MRLIPFILRAMPMAVTAVLISGCVGSGYLKDLNRYARKAKGPDIASSPAAPSTAFPENRNEGETPSPHPADRLPASSASEESTTFLTDATASPATKEQSASPKSENPVRQVASEAVSPTTSGDRSSENLANGDEVVRPKAQVQGSASQKAPPEVDWANNSRKDWFFLIMAGAGLLVGLFGVNIGWVVFLIFGGLFLYRKIVRRK
jgi:hypothetical protein